MSFLELTLLRHGRSLADDEGKVEGSYDSPLTEAGREQARALAAYWSASPPGFDRAWCSTLRRAAETAAVVTAPLGIDPVPTDLLREHDNGPLAGLPFAEAEARYPTPAFQHRLAPWTPDGGESDAAFRARALLALEQVWQGGGEKVLVVSHGGMLNAVLAALTGARATSFRFGDTAFATVRVSRDRDLVRILGIDQTPHLTS